MAKHVTLPQLSSVVNDITTKADLRFLKVADAGALATKDTVSESDLDSSLASKINGKADAGTTLSDYGITDAYTKTEVDNAIAESEASVCRPGGSLTEAQVVSSLLVKGNVGKVYNLSEDITTTADFAEGAGHVLPAGTNIQVIDADTTGSSPSYKFDTYAGAYGVATQSGNGLMSSTDKTKLDNADVTAYAAGNGVSISNHEVSAVVDNSNANGLSVGADGLAMAPASTATAGAMSAADKAKLDNADVTAYTAGNGIDISSHAVSAVVDSNNARGLSVGANGLALAAATPSTSGVGGTDGAMTAADKEKLNSFEEAAQSDIDAIIAGIWPAES